MTRNLSFDEAMAHLGVSRSTLYRWTQTGKVPASKVGRQWRFSAEELAAFVDGGVQREALHRKLAELASFLTGRDLRGKDAGEMAAETAEGTARNVAEAIIWHAHDRGASDVHLQPRRGGVRLAYRIQSGLEEVCMLEPGVADAVYQAWVSAGKPFGRGDGMRLFLSRPEPQAGGVTEVQANLQAAETVLGRRVAMRLFTPACLAGFERVCEDPEQRKVLEGYLAASHGLVLISGAAGSGKTTTALACARYLARNKALAVYSMEDPGSLLQVDGVDQVEVDAGDAGAFDAAFRTIMHMDPDVLLILMEHEAACRDAVLAARTGHLVLVQVHATSPAEALERFEAAAGERVQDILVGVSWQKLVPRPEGGRRGEYQFLRQP
jgi:excisionase family DNA binding protein